MCLSTSSQHICVSVLLLFCIKIITLRLAALLAGCAILLLLCAMLFSAAAGSRFFSPRVRVDCLSRITERGNRFQMYILTPRVRRHRRRLLFIIADRIQAKLYILAIYCRECALRAQTRRRPVAAPDLMHMHICYMLVFAHRFPSLFLAPFDEVCVCVCGF